MITEPRDSAHLGLSTSRTGETSCFKPAAVDGCLSGPEGYVRYQLGKRQEIGWCELAPLGPNGEAVSVVYEFEPHEPGVPRARPVVLNVDMNPSYLGDQSAYFSTTSPFADFRLAVFEGIPSNYGLLQVVRGVEFGIATGRTQPADVPVVIVEAMCDFWRRGARLPPRRGVRRHSGRSRS